MSRTGWGVFYHEQSLFGNSPISCPPQPPFKKLELAPIEIRDFVYRKLIDLSPAIKSNEIIEGPKGLRSRQILDFKNYGSLPQTHAERQHIAKQIRVLINREFPDFVRKQNSSVAGLPGFWLDKTEKIQLWSQKDYSSPMMLIPFCSAKGLIQACQIRFMSDKPINQVRYVWLSLTNKNNGISSGSPLHFAHFSHQMNKPLLLTEGALKAATIQKFWNKYDILANAGVSCSHHEIVSAARFRPLYIGFDNDVYKNIHVLRAFARLLNSIFSDALERKFQPRINILIWNMKFKGLDDALLQNISITSLSLIEWLNSLNDVWRNEVKACFRFV